MDPRAFNLRHLSAMAAIVRTGSISAAAKAVNLTQPAITQAVAKLEALVGQRLFDRQPGGMAPTPATLLLLPRVEAARRLVGSPRVTMSQLHALIALARAGSYAGAAVETGLSEPSLHRALADLSVALGAKLVERRGRGIALTVRGAAQARNFRLARAELQSGLDEVAALAGQEIGRIAIGAMPLSRARLLPDAVVQFYARHPDFDIAIVEGSHAELLRPLRDGDLDLLVGALRDPPPGDDVVQRPLFVDRPAVVARAGHPLALAQGPADMAGLAAFPWIVAAPGAPLRNFWEVMFRDAGMAPPRVPIECGSVIAIRQMLMQGNFLTLLSPDQLSVELEAGWLALVDGPRAPRRVIGVTTRRDWTPTPMQVRFLEMLDAAAASAPAVS